MQVQVLQNIKNILLSLLQFVSSSSSATLTKLVQAFKPAALLAKAIHCGIVL
jgi:hypothetical protein